MTPSPPLLQVPFPLFYIIALFPPPSPIPPLSYTPTLSPHSLIHPPPHRAPSHPPPRPFSPPPSSPRSMRFWTWCGVDVTRVCSLHPTPLAAAAVVAATTAVAAAVVKVSVARVRVLVRVVAKIQN